MKLDFATLAFGYSVKSGGNSPNWSTSFGQGKEHKINQSDEINEIIKGLIYKSVSPEKISTPIGKGGSRFYGNTDNSPIVIGSVFTNVYINNVKIDDAKFILIVTRDTAPSHYGRLKLKYNPENQFTDANEDYKNWDFFTKARKTLGLSDDACWFFTDLSIENQDTLKLTAVIVNKIASVTYEDADDLHNSWRELVPDLLDNTEETNVEATKYINPLQTIFYGVPGSGKSHEIKHKLEEEYKIPEEKQDVFVERTVFHPEYTNADFIGQIMPKLVQGKTDFVFKPGPFTSILKKALCDSQNRYVLIIEEINRGNAAAIFGELFQLLDRIDDERKKTSHDGSLNTYGKGWSEYFVMNSEINNYIRDSDDTFDGKALDLNGIHFSANTGIRLPPNLSILATMNTSDQNVFTLDNAFQRRWDMELIENVFGDTEEETNQRNAFVDSAKQITWEKFQTAINIKIGKMSEDAGLSSMEDKRLGCWFVKAVKLGDDYIISKDLFAEKVLKYLWDDAFKFCREKVFNGYTNLESLTRDFKGDKEFSVFKDLFSETEN